MVPAKPLDANAINKVNADGAGCWWTRAVRRGCCVPGVSNSGGSAGVTVAKNYDLVLVAALVVQAVGVDKSEFLLRLQVQAVTAVIGSANAYGVFGSGSSRTVIAVDEINASAVAGAGGKATSSNDGYG